MIKKQILKKYYLFIIYIYKKNQSIFLVDLTLSDPGEGFESINFLENE